MDLFATRYPSPQKLARLDHHWICVQIAKYRELIWQIIKFTQRTGFWKDCKPSQGKQSRTMRKLGKFLAWNKLAHQSLCDGGVHLRFPFPVTRSQRCCLLHVPGLRWSLHHCLSIACHLNPCTSGPLSSFSAFLWAESFPSQAGLSPPHGQTVTAPSSQHFPTYCLLPNFAQHQCV